MQLSAGEAILSLRETEASEEDENGEQPGKYPKPREETAATLGHAQMANCSWEGQHQLLGPKANSPAPHQALARLPSEVPEPIVRPGTSHPTQQAGGCRESDPPED